MQGHLSRNYRVSSRDIHWFGAFCLQVLLGTKLENKVWEGEGDLWLDILEIKACNNINTIFILSYYTANATPK